MRQFVFSPLWILCCCCLVYVRGHGVCTVGNLIKRINLTTELSSEILLPCLYEPALKESHLNKESSAVWIQIKTNTDHIVEISVNGQESFWNNRQHRIKVFREVAGSGNFSLLIRDVQLSDLGLYRCEIFRGINCSLGYVEIEISLATVEFSLLSNWRLIAAGGGGFLLLCLITVCFYCMLAKRQTVNTSINQTSDNCHDVDGQKKDEITYASVVLKSRTCHDSEGQKNNEITYASVVIKSHNCHDSEGLISPETDLYAAVKQRERR
ncbi:uncharacterized protein LOC122345011 isoform X2 [Puntigrus tetrazona]|uniref:uncharacterized protein LOC122345011 isoform X2 n=1 Tax=Puntigrus tetrazona TaxID=1606681 RepID=UPI001C898886|nr:uncharacterized protein LOC122345011 isoform X2 [Puntigrus tetrazona]